MTTDTLTLTQFLLREIAADEEAARAVIADEPRWDNSWTEEYEPDSPSPAARMIARHDPAHVLAVCAAHRSIVEEHSGANDERCQSWAGNWLDEPCDTLRALATIYADRPGFDPRWLA